MILRMMMELIAARMLIPTWGYESEMCRVCCGLGVDEDTNEPDEF